MGFGGYSYQAHAAMAGARRALPDQDVFRQRACHPLMNPLGVAVRESKDSGAHPSSLGIVFALDVTGSMGEIPSLLAKRELPPFVKLLLDHGIPDPQVLFMAIGDAFSDAAPLQVGQFESTGELMDQWLTWTWLEGKGGSGDHESYDLAIWFAARHLHLDCWARRGRRGYLFLTGDEKPYPFLSRQVVKTVFGDEAEEDLPIRVVVEEASRALEPFFLIPDLERRPRCERAWRDVLGDHVIALESPEDACAAAAGIVSLGEGAAGDLEVYARRLSDRGHPRERTGAVVRALTPWAATLGKDGAPEPELDRDAAIPLAGESSGFDRLRA